MKYYKEALAQIQTASNLAYRLSRPTQVPETASDQTQFSFGWQKHPVNEEYIAKIPEDLTLPIHQFIKDSVAAGNGVSVYFDNFYPTQAEADAKKALIIAATEPVNVIDILPSTWIETDHATLDSEGWFDDGETT